MSDRRTELGFERTVCDCGACKINCKFLPGFLLPSDISRIAEHLGYSSPVEFALDNLSASPGAIVMDHGQIRIIRTLTPTRRQDGACLFLDEEDRCRIHSVSPYGCSHFDAHQTKDEADLRSSAGRYQVDLAWKNDHLYTRLWLLLNNLGRVAPSLVDSRARMRAAINRLTSSPPKPDGSRWRFLRRTPVGFVSRRRRLPRRPTGWETQEAIDIACPSPKVRICRKHWISRLAPNIVGEMISGLIACISAFFFAFSRHRDLALKNLALRQQLAIFKRRACPSREPSSRRIWER